MSMIVARMQKMKAENLIGSGNHNQRKTENHSNKEIDIDRSHLNYDLVDQTQNYKRDILKFINKNKSTTRALRKDAVLVNEWIISSDRDFFDDLNENETRNFFQAAKDYFGEKFGDDNIRYATVHLDETTPHMHMGVVPFDDDNKLSAKRVFDRQALRDVQEELPKYLQDLRFEIERGREGSERKNLTVPEFKKMKEEQKEIKEEVDFRRNEFLSYVKDRPLESSIDDLNLEREMKDVKVPSGEKFLGHEFSKTVKKPTGNLLISQRDFKKIQDFNSHTKKSEAQLLNLLETDLYKENKELKNELQEQKIKNNKDIDDYNELVREYKDLDKENGSLKLEISNLRQEIEIIYKSTKDFLKERTEDLKAFKSVFKVLVDSISIKLQNNNLIGYFKKEYDKDNRIKASKKPGLNIEDLKRRADEINKSNEKENTHKKSRGISR